MISAYVMNGTFGKLYIDGHWQTNINKASARVQFDKRELKFIGDRWTHHKIFGFKGSGTMSGFKTSSDMIANGVRPFNIITSLNDPETYIANGGHYEKIILHNVLVDEITLASWGNAEEVMEETPFTFEGFEVPNLIPNPDSLASILTTGEAAIDWFAPGLGIWAAVGG
jgi:hypothetical protein